MLYYDRIGTSKGIDPTDNIRSRVCMICHYWFLNHEFTFHNYVCNGCDDLTMLSVNISDIAIITVKNVDYRCTYYGISKSEAINFLKNFIVEFRWYI